MLSANLSVHPLEHSVLYSKRWMDLCYLEEHCKDVRNNEVIEPRHRTLAQQWLHKEDCSGLLQCMFPTIAGDM